jgi:hypothetical protein
MVREHDVSPVAAGAVIPATTSFALEGIAGGSYFVGAISQVRENRTTRKPDS